MNATLDAAGLQRVIDAVAATVIAHADELTELDQAVGDGDHGINMKRGLEAVRQDAAAIAAKPLPAALHAIGMTLLTKVGGASGPLYATLLMSLGKAIDAAPDAAGFARAYAQAVVAVQARGKSAAGQKTMLDVLLAVDQALAEGGPGVLSRLPGIADAAAAATVPMQAVRGRASFLGARSVGHMDPGARSAALAVAAACRALQG